MPILDVLPIGPVRSFFSAVPQRKFLIRSSVIWGRVGCIGSVARAVGVLSTIGIQTEVQARHSAGLVQMLSVREIYKFVLLAQRVVGRKFKITRGKADE